MKYITAVILLILLLIPASSSASTSKSMVINEIQTSGLNELLHENGRDEFIELHNISDDEVDVTNLKLQYFSATRDDVFNISSSPTRELGLLNGIVQPKGYVLFSFENYIENADFYFGQGSTATSGLLARSGGHIRLVQNDIVLDVVAWGTAKSPETKVLLEIAAGTSVERKLSKDMVVDTDNNADDFMVQQIPTPQGGSLVEPELEIEPEPELVIPPCDGLMITEIVPNPGGVDTGKEFIELFNPTESLISLEDCTMKLDNSSYLYTFVPGQAIYPGEYKAFYDELTGITLPNATGGSVTLIGSSTDYTVEYPGNMQSDYSWSFLNQAWLNTATATPNAANILTVPDTQVLGDTDEVVESCGAGRYRNPETNRCRNIQTVAETSECLTGQIRNPETNRCRKIANIASSLIPCRPGQERSTETNRCRSITNIAASLIPCREGQERSSDTNRCRNVAATTKAECQQGYERNPETNRCRKTQAALAASPSVGDLDSPDGGRLSSVFMVIMSMSVFSYGAFEYRRDIMNFIEKYKLKLAAKQAVE